MIKFPVTLGVDFGTKRVGLAISRLRLAEPLETLAMGDTFWTKLPKIIDHYRVVQIVIGVSEKESARRAKEMGEEIKHRFGLRIFYYDETLSTHEARQRLSEAGHKLHLKEPVDHYAAAIILENWIEAVGLNLVKTDNKKQSESAIN